MFAFKLALAGALLFSWFGMVCSDDPELWFGIVLALGAALWVWA